MARSKIAGGAQQHVLGERRGHELEADRQVGLGKSARNADPGDTGEVGRDRIDVGQIHRQRVGRALADRESGRRRRRTHDHVHLLEGRVEVLADLAADLKSLVVILVGVSSRQCKGTQHDPTLDLRTKSFSAAGHHHSNERW